MNLVTKYLEAGEYYAEAHDKIAIFLHHTAGGHNPQYVIDGWEVDKTISGGQLKVGTPYIIGGISITDGNQQFDGQVWKTIPNDSFWLHHLGCTSPNNSQLNRQSIAIELTNYGYLVKTRDGRFVNYVGKEVPTNQVTELAQPFRGFKFWHRYTDRQLGALEDLLRHIADNHQIDLRLGLQQFIATGAGAFEFNNAALKGLGGVWSHGNVRKDKFDCYPCPRLIELIKSL